MSPIIIIPVNRDRRQLLLRVQGQLLQSLAQAEQVQVQAKSPLGVLRQRIQPEQKEIADSIGLVFVSSLDTKGRPAILAGRGELPWIAAREALSRDEDIRIFCFTDEVPPADLRQYCRPVVLTRMFRSVIRSMKRENVDRLVLLGKATRDILYKKPSFDLLTLYLVFRSISLSDTSIFETFAREFEKRGIRILNQTEYLSGLFLSEGRYGKKLSSKELEDVGYGMFYARQINRLDIGQTVVIGQKAVLAVEAAEGTDLAIERGGKIYHNKGAIVCKVAKLSHDSRFDIPVTGNTTLDTMHRSGCRVLAIEAGKTFVVNPVEFVQHAKQLGISILVLSPEKASFASTEKYSALSISNAEQYSGARFDLPAINKEYLNTLNRKKGDPEISGTEKKS